MTVTRWDTISSAEGPAVVLHRLALAIECLDALTDRPVGSQLLGRYRRVDAVPPPPGTPSRPWHDLPGRGAGGFLLQHAIPDDPLRPLPQLEILVGDPSRRYVPRRLVVTPWSYAEVAEPAGYVDARSRLLRVWLRPGSAYPFPRTASVIRGRLERSDGLPVRWARIVATTPTGDAGWAHVDERGEFLLPITDAGVDATRDYSPVDVTLTAYAPPAARVDQHDRTADLPAEQIVRSANPAQPADLDGAVLRGAAVPLGYIENTTAVPPVTVPVGAGLVVVAPIIVTP